MVKKHNIISSGLITSEKTSEKTSQKSDLTKILQAADKITLKDIEFDNTFREQSKILYDIKKLLDVENKYRTGSCDLLNNQNNQNEFNKLYYELKNKYSGLPTQDEINNFSPVQKNKKSKKIQNKKTQSSRIRKNSIKSNCKSNCDCKKHRKSISHTKINSKFPVVLVNKDKPVKNLIYVSFTPPEIKSKQLRNKA
jgi:hypothetical protein